MSADVKRGDKLNYFIIRHKLPSLNEYVCACRNNKYCGAKFKKDIEFKIELEILKHLNLGNLHKIDFLCELFIEYHMKDKRMDIDNIQSSQKFILDAMKNKKIIIDDSRKYIKNIYHKVIDDKDNFVIVYILKPDEIILKQRS